MINLFSFSFSGSNCPLCGKFEERMSDHFADQHDIMKTQYKAGRAIKAGDERDHRYLICPKCSVITDRMDLHGRNAHHYRGDRNYHKRAALVKRASAVSIPLMLFVFCYL